MSTTFADVVPVTPTSSHTYMLDLQDEWCIGSVPNGGYITSTFLLVARTHMLTTHPTRSAPHPINLHLEFLRRTSANPARYTVKDIKLGSRISNLHITLSQQQAHGDWQDEVEGYITISNFTREVGLTLCTSHKIHPPTPPANLPLLAAVGEDPSWLRRHREPFPTFRRATQHIQFHLLKPSAREKVKMPLSIGDQWIRFTPHKQPGKWTNDALGYVVDMFPQIVEAYVNPNLEETTSANGDLQSVLDEKREPRAKYWYPTLSLNLDIKKLLPEAGVEWLFVRARARTIRNGRFDLDVEVRDEQDDVVAISSHCSLIMGTERNLSRRSRKKDSKI